MHEGETSHAMTSHKDVIQASQVTRDSIKKVMFTLI